MTAVVIEATGEVVEQMTAVEAERITSRIADKLDAIADNLEQVLPLIGEALTRDAWKALGYASPTAYVSERFAGALTRLAPDVRRPVVAQLSAAGMSTRAIAPVVGVTHKTVVKDRQAVPPVPGEPASRILNAVSPVSAPSAETPAHSPRITGMDGKQYSRPASGHSSSAKAGPNGSAVGEKKHSREAEIINDIRLWLREMGRSTEIQRMDPQAKHLIIDALQETINSIKGETS